MRYIDSWLSGLGLEYIIPKLKANGITTPKKLALLTLRDMYEVVGVEDAEDRKKLYFLIQRLQTILTNKLDTQVNREEEDDEEDRSQDDNHSRRSYRADRSSDEYRREKEERRSVDDIRVSASKNPTRRRTDSGKNSLNNTFTQRSVAETSRDDRDDDLRSATISEHHEEDLRTLRQKYRASMNESARRTLDSPQPERSRSSSPVDMAARMSPNSPQMRPRNAAATNISNGYTASTASTLAKGQGLGSNDSRGEATPKSKQPVSRAIPTKSTPSSSSKIPDLSSRSRIPSPTQNSYSRPTSERMRPLNDSPPSSPPRTAQSSQRAADNPFRGLDLAPKPYQGSKRAEGREREREREDNPVRNSIKMRSDQGSDRERERERGERERERGERERERERERDSRQQSSTQSPSRYSRKQQEMDDLMFEEEEEEEVAAPINRREGAYQRQQREAQEKLEQQQMAFLQQQQDERNRPVEDMAIRVVVRKRPISRIENSRGDRDVMDIRLGGQVLIHQPMTKVDLTKIIETQSFTFDDAFDATESNEMMYNRTISPLVSFLFDGGKASCFAYGQTGSGKTFTMMGCKPHDPKEVTENAGLYVLAAREIFSKLNGHGNRGHNHGHKHNQNVANLSLYVSCFEIYGGKLFDLLNEHSTVKCMEDAKHNVQLLGLSEHLVTDVSELLVMMSRAHGFRSTGSTGANQESSRSHQVMQLSLRERVATGQPTLVGAGRRKVAAPAAPKTIGKLSFIDLAGSERGSDLAHNSKQTRMEGAEINTSLLALKEVIRSLEKKHGHTPFRGSKLTQVLKDSFVGERSRTCMIACVSPAHSNCEHTLNTLRYADRVKEHQTTTGGDGGGAGVGGAKDPKPLLPVSSDESGKNDKKTRGKSCYENYENYDSYSINGIVDGEAEILRDERDKRWRSMSRDRSMDGAGAGAYSSPVLGNKVPAKKVSDSIDLYDDYDSSGKGRGELVRHNSRKNLLLPKQAILDPPVKKVAPKAPPIVQNTNMYNQKQKRVQENVRDRGRSRDDDDEDDPDELGSFKIEHHSYSKPHRRHSDPEDDASVSDFGNYEDRSEDDGYGDLLDDDDFGGLGGLGDTGMIQRTVGLLRAHKLAISEMVEIMKDEMEIVQDMESAEDRDCDVYLDKLEHILELKSEAIFSLSRELKNFNKLR